MKKVVLAFEKQNFECAKLELDVKNGQKLLKMRKSMLSLEFWDAKKEPPEAQKQEFVLSLEFLAAKWAVLGSPGGRKEHFYHVFKQNLQKAQKS